MEHRQIEKLLLVGVPFVGHDGKVLLHASQEPRAIVFGRDHRGRLSLAAHRFDNRLDLLVPRVRSNVVDDARVDDRSLIVRMARDEQRVIDDAVLGQELRVGEQSFHHGPLRMQPNVEGMLLRLREKVLVEKNGVRLTFVDGHQTISHRTLEIVDHRWEARVDGQGLVVQQILQHENVALEVLARDAVPVLDVVDAEDFRQRGRTIVFQRVRDVVDVRRGERGEGLRLFLIEIFEHEDVVERLPEFGFRLSSSRLPLLAA